MIHMIQELFGRTLRDAGDHVTSLPKAEQDLNVADVCESARGPDADRHVKRLIQLELERPLFGAYSQKLRSSRHSMARG